MKNLKKIVFGLLAMLVMVTSVNAASTITCNKPGESLEGVTDSCEAAVDGIGFKAIDDAWTMIHSNTGKEIELYTDLPINVARTFDKEVIINANGHKITFASGIALTVAAKGSLTIKDAEILATNSVPFEIINGGALALNNVKATTSTTVLNNRGTVTIEGGSYTSAAAGSAVFNNIAGGNLTITNATIVAGSATGSVVNNAGVVSLEGLTVTAKDAALVNVAAHNSETTLVSGTYELKNVIVSSLTASPVADNQEVAAKVAIKDGEYITEAHALKDLDHNMVVTIDGGNIHAKTSTAIKIYCADVTINGGTFTADKGYVVETVHATDDTKAPNASLTINGGNFISAASKSKYVLHLGRARMTYAITGGVFESTGDPKKAAIELDNTYLAITTDAEGNTVVPKAVAGILTGGKYLNNIIAVVTNAFGGTVNVSNQLVAEGYTIKVEDPYKIVVSTKEPEAVKYNITVEDSENGELTVDKTEAEEGELVTITVKTAEGYKLVKVLVSNGVEVTANEDGTYSFAMPASDVTVSAEFEKVPVNNPTDDGEETDTNKGDTDTNNNTGNTPADENNSENPSTLDSIVSIVTLAISSLGTAGYSIKKFIRK